MTAAGSRVLFTVDLADVPPDQRAAEIAELAGALHREFPAFRLVQWIAADVAGRGWIAFHKDDGIRHKDEEIAAVQRHGLRMFVITNANLTGALMAQRYVNNIARISRAARRPGPWIYGVYEKGIDPLWRGERL